SACGARHTECAVYFEIHAEGETLMDTVIETRDLCKSFGGKPAVERLSLSVPKGAIFAFLGDNGAGKTTTIRMLTGLLPAHTGSGTILGQDCWKAATALKSQDEYVPEQPR